jgi:hypothetical protein
MKVDWGKLAESEALIERVKRVLVP